jgi:endoglucanase
VSSALVFREHGNNSAYYDQLMTAAGGLYRQATRHEGAYTARFKYDCTSKFARARVTSKVPRAACPPPTAFANGSALVFYNSTSYRDDLLWAAAWMYRATNDTAYLQDVNKYYGAHVDMEGERDLSLTFDWDNMFFASNVLLAQLTDEGAFHVAVQDMLKQWICSTTGKVLFTPRGRAWNRASPTTGGTANAALLSLMYGQMKSKFLTVGKRRCATSWGTGAAA